LIALPSLLLGLLLAPIASAASGGLLMLADLSVITTKALLDSLISIVPPRAQSLGYLSAGTALIVSFAAWAYFLPLSRIHKSITVLGLSCLLLTNQTGVSFGQIRLQVLDVGQGSAAILDTKSRRIVIDAGPRFDNRFDAGQSIVIPALRSTGADHVDLLMLTHMDNDHAGGRMSLMGRYPSVERLFVAEACEHNKSWLWDGVRFSVLQDKDGASRNDRSCTLLVETDASNAEGQQRIYLSGDVSKAAEDVLTAWLPRNLALLVTPHHGSRSSSSSVFVRHVAPHWAVHSAGRSNRYGHPHDIVTGRYRLEGADQVVTGRVGGVTWNSLMPGYLLTQHDHWLVRER
jgi:competence protein ComEC